MNGGPRRVPDKTKLRAYLDQGLTQAQVADQWRIDSGEHVTREAIAMAMKRWGLKSKRPRPRYTNLLPWRVREEHAIAYDARMLRLEGRRRRHGTKALSSDEATKLRNWKKRLRAENRVIHYDPETEGGFWWVPARPGIDTDLIRHPDNETI